MNTQNSKKKSVSDNLGNFFTSPTFVLGLVLLYMMIIAILLLAELDFSGLARFRATDKVVILFVLLFMPFFIVAAPKFVSTLTLKFGAGREVQVQLNKVSEHLDSAFGDLEKKVARQVSTAEQALWPLLAGNNPFAIDRWQAATPEIIIGSKEDVSHIFFAHFLKQWLEKEMPNIHCSVRYPNGGSLKNFADVKHSWIDMYIDFTGTCCQYFNIDHKNKSDEKIVGDLNSYCVPLGMKFTLPLGATENYLLVMRRSLAEDLKIETIEDLCNMSEQLHFSADPEYLNRKDCWLGLEREYGLKFKEIIPCDVTQRYALLEDNQAHVFVGYETDPEIKNHDLIKIIDSRQFFPRYAAAPLVNTGALKNIAGLEDALNLLQNTMSTDDLVGIVRDLARGKRDRQSIFDEQEEKVRERIREKTVEVT